MPYFPLLVFSQNGTDGTGIEEYLAVEPSTR
jgi:hypothetical protein